MPVPVDLLIVRLTVPRHVDKLRWLDAPLFEFYFNDQLHP